MDATHASFFSGVGGLDLGLERAGWRTVSFSEIDPYASAVLRERWPGVPNLGDITAVRAPERAGGELGRVNGGDGPASGSIQEWQSACLWTGGFPCQDLSVAGKRRGFTIHEIGSEAGHTTRSDLAFAFFDLVRAARDMGRAPRAILLENVPGLLSSHGGKDLGALLGLLGDLGYGWAFRVLDAQWFGVPQRRRRVFVLALDLERHPDAFGAAEVLAVGTRCGRDHPSEREAWARAAGRTQDRPRGTSDPAHAITGTFYKRHDEDTDTLVVDRPSPDPDGVRAPDGLAGRLDGRGGLGSVGSGNGGVDDNDARSGHLVYVKAGRAQSADDDESWREGDVSPTLNAFDVGDSRAVTLAVEASGSSARPRDATEPEGLDSHRYRCCGNGVVAPVAEWIGRRLLEALS